MQYGFYFDQTRCMGCMTCAVACKDWNDVKPGPAKWRRVTVTEENDYPKTVVYNLSISCNHCEAPACLLACPIDAISKGDNGIVLVDRDKCQRLGACAIACPYGGIQFGDDVSEPKSESSWQVPHPAQKCTFCKDRLEIGKNPACVDSCPQRALDFGDMEELKKKYPKATRTATSFPDDTKNSLGEDLGFGTGPSILFKAK